MSDEKSDRGPSGRSYIILARPRNLEGRRGAERTMRRSSHREAGKEKARWFPSGLDEKAARDAAEVWRTRR